MRGTGRVRQLCGICFWESRVDPIMEWCPCYNNARLRDEHYDLRARALPCKAIRASHGMVPARLIFRSPVTGPGVVP